MAEAQSLRVEAGECMTLSPDSERFKHTYRQVRPRSAEEVREVLGLSPEATKALRENGVCRYDSAVPAATADAADLDSEDPEIRAAARQSTHAAFKAYVYGTAAASLEYLTPVFDRYLDINKAVLNIATFGDIEVMDGATLTISPSTQAVLANKITIHRTGRIVCGGSTTFRITALEGIRPGRVSKPVTTAVTAAAARRKQ